LLHYSATVAAIDKDDFRMDVGLQWRLPYRTLTILAKIFQVFPSFVDQDDGMLECPWQFTTFFLDGMPLARISPTKLRHQTISLFISDNRSLQPQ
jgi:hypothetical protein